MASSHTSFKHMTLVSVSGLLPALGLNEKYYSQPLQLAYAQFLYDVITKYTVLRNRAKRFACFKDWHRSLVTTMGYCGSVGTMATVQQVPYFFVNQAKVLLQVWEGYMVVIDDDDDDDEWVFVGVKVI